MAQKDIALDKAGKQTLKQIEQQYEAALTEATGQSVKLTRDLADREDRVKKLNARIDNFMEKVSAKESKSHRVAVDLGGGSIAQVSTELINWGVRALGRWSKDGFFANNVDLLQGMPHFVIGLGIYIAEMATRIYASESMLYRTAGLICSATRTASTRSRSIRLSIGPTSARPMSAGRSRRLSIFVFP